MKLWLEESQAVYSSGPQNARVLSESWAMENLYCPVCTNAKLRQFPANSPVADFFCSKCNDQFELKSKNGKFGKKIANGAYETKIARLHSTDAPHWILLEYTKENYTVENVEIIPRHFFNSRIVEKRKPLSAKARRAGWVGSNILLHKIPAAGRISYVKNQIISQPEAVRRQFEKLSFLSKEPDKAKGWLLAVLRCVEKLDRTEFSLADVYEQETQLALQFPKNQHIRPKIRQQLQVLRDNNYIEFLGNGRYRLIDNLT